MRTEDKPFNKPVRRLKEETVKATITTRVKR